METAEFEARKRQREEEAEVKTAKNRAKRQKKKERAKAGKVGTKAEGSSGTRVETKRVEIPLKKKRLVNGAEVVFRRPGEEGEVESHEEAEVMPSPAAIENKTRP